MTCFSVPLPAGTLTCFANDGPRMQSKNNAPRLLAGSNLPTNDWPFHTPAVCCSHLGQPHENFSCQFSLSPYLQLRGHPAPHSMIRIWKRVPGGTQMGSLPSFLYCLIEIKNHHKPEKNYLPAPKMLQSNISSAIQAARLVLALQDQHGNRQTMLQAIH